eukprot:TRINITY_DN6146_c0_g1_i2.p1 TRINITY_DN6146_c0_g1~~TRINITY_DN6146_c0_g1_i2.p1  ORF type:complete len:236 (+),score=53.32 TRINITY_DN6146_c0_g1_i2:340-1047(+)
MCTSPMKLPHPVLNTSQSVSAQPSDSNFSPILPWLDESAILRAYQETHFTKLDLEQLEEKYRSLCGEDSWMGKAALYTAFRGTEDHGCLALDRLFACLDGDQDGWVSPLEYVFGMELLVHGTAAQKAEFAFRMYDLDQVGEVQKRQLQEVSRSILGVIQNSYSGQGSGLVIDQGEESVDELVDSIISSAFEDVGSDSLSLAGFNAICEDHFAVLDNFIRDHARQSLNQSCRTATE